MIFTLPLVLIGLVLTFAGWLARRLQKKAVTGE
jgi:hypothetical protein